MLLTANWKLGQLGQAVDKSRRSTTTATNPNQWMLHVACGAWRGACLVSCAVRMYISLKAQRW
jgi:hypothetical protein